ncbi:MAG: hypothetical protein AAGA35_04340 [Patescibacteria group bacterium]
MKARKKKANGNTAVLSDEDIGQVLVAYLNGHADHDHTLLPYALKMIKKRMRDRRKTLLGRIRSDPASVWREPDAKPLLEQTVTQHFEKMRPKLLNRWDDAIEACSELAEAYEQAVKFKRDLNKAHPSRRMHHRAEQRVRINALKSCAMHPHALGKLETLLFDKTIYGIPPKSHLRLVR